MISQRPIIQLTPSRTDIILDRVSLIFLILMWSFLIYAYLSLPDIISIHYNLKGEPDNYGNKIVLWIMPVIGTILFVILTKLNKYPHIFNYFTEITQENAALQYTLATRSLRYIKLILVIAFLLVTIFMYVDSIHLFSNTPKFLLPVICITTLLPVFICIYFVRKGNKKN